MSRTVSYDDNGEITSIVHHGASESFETHKPWFPEKQVEQPPQPKVVAEPPRQPIKPPTGMKFLYLDFETFYCSKTGYTLSKMTAEEYVRDPRFESIGFAYGYLPAGEWWKGLSVQQVMQVVYQNIRWFTGTHEEQRQVLATLDWSDSFVVGHNNSMFDSLIITERFGFRPAAYGCTLQLARCLHGGKTPEGKSISNALGALAKMYNLPMEKGDEVVKADGKRRLDFTPQDLADYGNYCIKDTALAGMLWQVMSPQFPKSELLLASTFTKMWAEPRMVLDGPLLAAMGVEMAERKAALLSKVADILGVGTTMPFDERMMHTQKLLRSDAKFAELLTQFDVEIPMKRSPKKRDAEGKAMEVYAFAKTDEGMTNLLEYDEQDEETNAAVQALAAARLGTKSTQAEGRVHRLHGIAVRGSLTVPVEYGKTLTDRAAGGGRINLQNLNQIKGITKKTPNGSLIMTPGGWSRLFKRAPDMSKIMDAEQRVWDTADCHVVGLRDTIMAPPGYKLVVADLSNVELRVAHYLCGEESTMEALRRGEDLYCRFSSTFYGRPITKADKKERQHGKVAMLQLQFQSGAEAFRRAARIMAGVRMTEQEAQQTVDVYRGMYSNIKQMWWTGQQAIPKCANGGGFWLDQRGLCYVEHNAIRRPNGMRLRYHNLRQEELLGFDGLPEVSWVYDDKETRKMTKTYGGKFGVQGPTQSLSRDIIVHHQNQIERALVGNNDRTEGVTLCVHDEVVSVVREDRAEWALDMMLEVMHKPPQWCADLPLAAEGAIGQRYSSCK